MLVDNKFLYISLPRCGSTSFHISCLRSGFKLEHYKQSFIDNYHTPIDLNLSNTYIANNMAHLHETANSLLSKFGNEYEIISVKRDKHQRFISAWKYIIQMFYADGNIEAANIFKKIELDNILFYSYSDLVSNEELVFNEFIKRNKLEKYLPTPIMYYTRDIITMLKILIRDVSYWHNNNPKIKWFEFGKFEELEEWVSNKTGKPFKMERSNVGQDFECNLKLDEKFIKRYNNIYDYYDNQKTNKTLI